MKINNYKDLEEYRNQLQKKHDVSKSILTRQLDKKKSRLQNLVKMASIPLATTLVGALVYKWTSNDAGAGENSNPNESVRRTSPNTSAIVKDLLQIAKILIPVMTAVWAKEQTEEVGN